MKLPKSYFQQTKFCKFYVPLRLTLRIFTSFCGSVLLLISPQIQANTVVEQTKILSLAQQQVQLGEFDKGILMLSTTNFKGSDKIKSLLLLGRAYKAKREFVKALNAYQSVLKLEPKNARALAGIGLVKAGQGNIKESITWFDQAIWADPHLSSSYSNRGIAKAALNDLKGALADMDFAIQKNPIFADGYRNRGIIKEMLSDLRGACKDWEKAKALGQDNPGEWIEKQCQTYLEKM